MYRKLLIANRGEIACRIARTARRLGVQTVAVYSQADAYARHVAYADEAWPIGGAPSCESYLSVDKIIDVARLSGAGAIHPGYGFLAENAAFAERCAEAGLDFIGPPPHAMRLLGSKSCAKSLMARAGIPIVPGYHGESADRGRLREEANRIGFPLLVKASAGGGGRGMRIVESPGAFDEAVASAEREALASFGDARLLLERYLVRPRHIEIQIFADTHGAVVAFPARDCSIQRHHQKVIEETPAVGLSPMIALDLRQAAMRAASLVGYVGAGTVEFLVDGNLFYFLEVNARLQVEHPITEMISGVDLVEWQLRVACGEPLPLLQDKIEMRGHAIEARICAEDPARGFIPSVGVIKHFSAPEGDGVRVDTGFLEGDRFTEHYDSLIAKLVVHGSDRQETVQKLQRALDDCEIIGITTNLDFLRAISRDPGYLIGELRTDFVARELPALVAPRVVATDTLLLATAAAMYYCSLHKPRLQSSGLVGQSPWEVADAWRLYDRSAVEATFRYDDRLCSTRLLPLSRMAFQLQTTEDTVQVEYALSGAHLRLRIDGVARTLTVVQDKTRFTVTVSGRNHILELVERGKGISPLSTDDTLLSAPIPARVTRVLARPGETVSKGAALVVLEAMKMEFTLRAPRAGVISDVRCVEGDQAQEGAPLVTFEAESA